MSDRKFEIEVSNSEGNTVGKFIMTADSRPTRYDLVISSVDEIVDQSMIDESGLEIGGVQFTPEQVKVIIQSVDSAQRVNWMYGNTPSPWERSDCEKWLTAHGIYWY